MEFSLADQISASPALKWVMLAIIFNILNVFLGLYLAFMKKEPAILKIHGYLFFTILLCYGCFLILQGIHGDISLLEYFVGLYFITLVPFSKRWDAMIHGLISLLGLLLLPLVILMRFI